MNRLIYFLLLVASLTMPDVLAAQTVPLENFFKHMQFRNIKISPDGRYLAATSPKEDSTSLAIIDRTTNKYSAVINFDRYEHAREFMWVNNERLIVDTEIKIGALDRPVMTGDLYALNADGGKKVQLLPEQTRGRSTGHVVKYYFDIISRLKDDPDHILISHYGTGDYPTPYKMNVYNGSMLKLGNSPVKHASYAADHNGQLRFAVGRDDDLIKKVYYRESDDVDWKLIEEYKDSEGGMMPLGFTPDNKQVYILSDRNAPTDGIYLYNPASGDKKLLFRSDVVDIDDVIWNQNGKAIGVGYQPDFPRVSYFDPEDELSQMLAGVQQSLGDSQHSIMTSITDDGSKAVVRAYSDKNPGDFYLLDTQSKQVTYLLSRMAWIKPKQLSERKPITLTARDGLQLHGYLTLPKDTPAEDLPMIVLPHGGPHGPRDVWAFDPEAQFFASRGYAVLQLNFRGSGGYGRDFEFSGYRKWGTVMQDDLTDGTLWAIEQGVADPKRICIYGASYGGYAALMGVIREPDLYRCAVGYVGVYSLPLMYEVGDIQDRESGKNYLKYALGTDETDLKARSPVYNVDKIKVPVFLVHGKKDQRVPIDHFDKLVNALDKADKKFITLTKPLEAHGFYDEENRFELYNKMLEFFDEHIGS